MVKRLLIFAVGIGLILSSCVRETITPTSIPTKTGMLTPYHTITPTYPMPTATLMVIIPETPAPTATPFLHTITNDDTMLGIAYKYGISLEELQAANPGIDSHFLSVGKQLIIPIKGEIPETLPSLTPVPVKSGDARCYHTGEGGAWCIVSVSNTLETSIENLSAWIGLFSKRGENIANQTVFAPLNMVRPGATIPLLAYFAPPLPVEFEVQSKILSAFSLAENDNRYLNLQVNTEPEIINPDGSAANIKGKIVIDDDSASPAHVWVLAVAYDTEGNVIGVRKWESSGELDFDLTVYSLGGAIDKVEVLAEARP